MRKHLSPSKKKYIEAAKKRKISTNISGTYVEGNLDDKDILLPEEVYKEKVHIVITKTRIIFL